ncbi:MAG: hypothetical protein OXH65_06365 [Paracoccaceae bacterium]|nr:hypothetical protein [Paracoccaceae bacterium]
MKNQERQEHWDSKEWKKRKQRIAQAEGYKCAICGEKHKSIQLHHTNIDDYQDIETYKETPEVVIVCMDCHDKEHGYLAQYELLDRLVLCILKRYATEWFTYDDVDNRYLRDRNEKQFYIQMLETGIDNTNTFAVYAACKRHREKAAEVDSVKIKGIWYISYWRQS